MGLRGALARFASKAPVPVFVVAGGGAGEAVQLLRLRPELELVSTPRHADILLVAGSFPPGEVPALAAVHDQIPAPRATVRWLGDPLAVPKSAVHVPGDENALVTALVGRRNQILVHPGLSEPLLLPDVDPVEWRGVGPYGHGGKGMTGGTPFGRPLAERAPDRDGLELDQLPVTIGPWGGALPCGLRLSVKLQGDLIQEAELLDPTVSHDPPDIFAEATISPRPLAALEFARARHHLHWLSRALVVHGLPALARRAVRVARDLENIGPGQVETLLRMVRRSGIFGLSVDGVGPLAASDAEGLGPVSRASGNPEDARSDDPSYQELGFHLVTFERGDAGARWRQRLAEIGQSLDLAVRAGDRTAFGDGVAEGPRGPVTPNGDTSTANLDTAVSLLPGMEWGDGVSSLWSFDVDPAAAKVPVAAREDRS